MNQLDAGQSPAQPQSQTKTQPNAETFVEVTRDQLPLHCPTPATSLWNSHPKVYIPLEDTPEARCHYCGTVYRLVERPPG